MIFGKTVKTRTFEPGSYKAKERLRVRIGWDGSSCKYTKICIEENEIIHITEVKYHASGACRGKIIHPKVKESGVQTIPMATKNGEIKVKRVKNDKVFPLKISIFYVFGC